MMQPVFRDVRSMNGFSASKRRSMLRGALSLVCGLVLLVAFSGCSKSSFVGKRFDNFTAYYNKFYNAERAYREGEKGIVQDDQPINRDLYIQIFVTPERPGNAKSFNDAIKKSADVLRSHPDSKWADDALLLIGKSYFYLQNYVGAEQKFREVIDLSGRLEDEARFWLARTMIASGAYAEANEHLLNSLNRDGLTKRWSPMLRLALAELHVQRQEWDNAATELEQAVDRVSNREFGARAQFLLGQVLETLGRYEDAVRAFERVDRFKPLYELSYASNYSAVRVEGIHGDAARALRELRSMERDDNNFSYMAQLDFLRGQIYQANGDIYDAEGVYYDLLYDENTNLGTISGRIHYALAELYQEAFEDFVLAAAHYDTASTSLRRPASTRGAGGSSAGADELAYTQEAITDVGEKAEVFKEFATVYDQVYTQDSLLYLGSLDTEAFDAKILQLRQELAEQQKAEREAMERRQRERAFAGGVSAAASGAQRGAGSGSKNLSSQGGNNSAGDTGFLNHKDRIRLQEGRASFIDQWGERPLVPNWRRLEAISAADAVAQGGEGGALTLDAIGEGEDDTLPTIDLSPVPRDSTSQADMRAERALSRYELANTLFLSMNRPDSAAVWYRMVIEEDSNQPVAQRAYFALAELQRSLGDSLTADQLYRQVVAEYPESDFAEEVRERLGLPPLEVAVTDSLVLAQQAYEEAYTIWQAGELDQALDQMLAIGLYYEETDVAPQALLAAGSIYTEIAVRDSLDVFGEIPIVAPDSLLIARGWVEKVEIPAAGDSLAISSDSLLVASDSLRVLSDSMMVATSDTLAVVKDSMNVAVADSAAAQVVTDTPSEGAAPVAVQDSVHTVVADSARAAMALATDSLAVPPDSIQIASDSLAIAEEEPVQLASVEAGPLLLEALYASISRSYQQTPYAQQATVMLSALKSHRADMEALADSLGRLALADSLGVSYDSVDVALAAIDSAAVAVDSLGSPIPADSSQVVTEGDDLDAQGNPRDVVAVDEADAVPFDDDMQARDARPAALDDEGEVDEVDVDERDTLEGESRSTETPPQLIGTLEQIMRLVKYPESALAEQLEGDLTVEFTVTPQGNAILPIIKTPLSEALDAEALRILKLTRFRAGSVRGAATEMRMSLTLPFRLPEAEEEEKAKTKQNQ